MTRPRLLVPEVVQTSNMDCGPASLKALLEGFGISASYGRLREACQTDVDGTSIDMLESLAAQLGLDAEQVMVPVDHVLTETPPVLPAIAVVRLPNGFTHFVVAWRRLGPWVQVMDPATGRRWVPTARFLDDLYVNEMSVPAEAFDEWIASDTFAGALRVRLAALGCAGEGSALFGGATGWRDRAALDAATRWVASVVRSGALHAGREAAAALAIAYEQARTQGEEAIARPYWTALPAPAADDGTEMIRLRGAVLVRVAGPRASGAEAPAPLSPELVRALEEPAPRPWRTLVRQLGGEGSAGSALRASLAAAVVATAVGGVLEALLLRGAMNLGRDLGVVQQRLGATIALLVFLVGLLAIEVPTAWGAARLGRRLETRLRVAFLEKVPRLGDRYFASRPVSDMAERCHMGYRVRVLPTVAAGALRLVAEIAVTALGIAWLDPRSAVWGLVAAACAVIVPAVFLPSLGERDMRMRTHEGALARFYLDALLGLSAIRTHGAERSVAREHESLLVEWARASRALVSAYVSADLVQSLLGTLFAAAMLVRYVAVGGDPAGVLLLVYWALSLPSLGQELGVLLRQIPGHRNTALRLLEPLGALEDEAEAEGDTEAAGARAAVGIELDDVGVLASGHRVLDEVSLHIAPGEHVAIVGASGAGKSSLLGLLLGWHRASSGELRIDGAKMSGPVLRALRERTAWIDPAVQLWNRSLVDNLLYGAPRDAAARLGPVLGAAELAGVLEKLPDGLQTALGEGGGLVSGGEGQRVRLARGLLREGAGLVLLDEPFRGLERDRRHALMGRVRTWWKDATVLCVTHDVRETTGFPRVLVVEEGRVIEDGAPSELAARPSSRYRTMLDAEIDVQSGVWGADRWRRVRVEGGTLREDGAPTAHEERA